MVDADVVLGVIDEVADLVQCILGEGVLLDPVYDFFGQREGFVVHEVLFSGESEGVVDQGGVFADPEAEVSWGGHEQVVVVGGLPGVWGGAWGDRQQDSGVHGTDEVLGVFIGDLHMGS
jgi:hypothetical protein